MTPKRWLIIAVWIIVVGVIVTMFLGKDKRLGHVDDLSTVPTSPASMTTPSPTHFYALPGSTPNNGEPKPDVANVQQVSFTISDNTPNQFSFTCHVMLMNKGKAKAEKVQVWVRPYRGAWLGDPENDNADNPAHQITDDSPLGQFGSWVSFPDIDPGQTLTKDVVFMKQQDAGKTGRNPNPQITFETAAPAPPPASTGPKFPPNL